MRVKLLFKISFYVPVEQCETVKLAMFSAGAGRYEQPVNMTAQGVKGRVEKGDTYDRCAWQTLGDGQFRPLDGSQPAIGEIGEVTVVPEYKVEMLCSKDCLHTVVSALISAHPYEQVAYHIVPVFALSDLSLD